MSAGQTDEVKNLPDGEEELTTNPRILEVALWIEKGESYSSITKEFCERWSLSDRTIRRYLAVAREVVADRISKGKSILDNVRKQLIEEEVKRQLPGNSEIEKMLWEIAKGEIEIIKIVNTKNGLEPVSCKANFTHRLQALDKIWKMRCKEPKGANSDSPLVQIITRDEAQKQMVEKYIDFLKPASPAKQSSPVDWGAASPARMSSPLHSNGSASPEISAVPIESSGSASPETSAAPSETAGAVPIESSGTVPIESSGATSTAKQSSPLHSNGSDSPETSAVPPEIAGAVPIESSGGTDSAINSSTPNMLNKDSQEAA